MRLILFGIELDNITQAIVQNLLALDAERLPTHNACVDDILGLGDVLIVLHSAVQTDGRVARVLIRHRAIFLLIKGKLGNWIRLALDYQDLIGEAVA